MRSSIKKLLELFCLTGIFMTACAPKEQEEAQFRLSFGSCSSQLKDQSYWERIESLKPQMWFWLGDSIYPEGSTEEALRVAYAKIYENPYYKRFRRNVEIRGVWDDKEIAESDAGKEFSAQVMKKDLFLNFLEIPKRSSVWRRKGTYYSEFVGPVKKSVKVFFLDTRSFRDPLKRDESLRRGYSPHKGDVLGEQQWKWLEKEIKKSLDAEVHLFVSSIPVLPMDNAWEGWSRLPDARRKLIDMIDSYDLKRPIILSGERHISELSVYERKNKKALYDATSSSLTHSWVSAQEENRYRKGSLIRENNFSLLDFKWKKGKLVDLKLQYRRSSDASVIEEHSLL